MPRYRGILDCRIIPCGRGAQRQQLGRLVRGLDLRNRIRDGRSGVPPRQWITVIGCPIRRPPIRCLNDAIRGTG
jgi:hypothetical protein